MSDWSANPLIALFFAVELDATAEASPVVYRYPITSEIVERDKRASPLEIPHTRVIQPGVHSHRSEAQAAWHIVHAIHLGEDNIYRFNQLDKMPPHNTRISLIPIEKSKVKVIRAELALMGISHSTVYGDYQSVCRAIGPAFGIS
jgi:hypothetical protein